MTRLPLEELTAQCTKSTFSGRIRAFNLTIHPISQAPKLNYPVFMTLRIGFSSAARAMLS